MHTAPEDELVARLAAAGLTGLNSADLAWLREAAAKARAFALPPGCPPATMPAALFTPLARDDD
ncbi:MAG: hypothetical protein JWN73_2217 [Betaproteobacteria bacterium]|nr:hypothetical protein [Betaproteobacteria bacterium]